jgi:hypothetical protein
MTKEITRNPAEAEKLDGETFIRSIVRLEQLARTLEGNYSDELTFPEEWVPIEEAYHELKELWSKKYASLDKRCQKSAESARAVDIPRDVARLYYNIMNYDAVRKRFKQAPILLMGFGFV